MQRVIAHRLVKRPRQPARRGRRAPLQVWAFLAAFNLLLFSLAGCGATLVGGGIGTVYAFNAIKRDLPDPSYLATEPLAQVTQLYDRTGQHLLYEFYDERRIAVPLDQVSPVMISATLAIEDAGFYEHPGYDWKGIIRAAFLNLRTHETVSGASTITQQLVKRMLLSDEQTMTRKVREIVLATQVESMYSKDKILEMYLNQVYYGNQAYGIEAAARSYFGVHASELDLAQASVLAGLVQAPSAYDPVSNHEAAAARQQQVLDAMVKHGFASEAEAQTAAEEAQDFTYRMQETSIQYPHFSFFVKERLQQWLPPEVVRDGVKVTTTLDVDMQERAQAIVRKRVDEIRWQHVNNGALVALDPRTGQVLAMVGSYDYYDKSIDGQVNVATALRQPGSSFKPFTYAAAFATRIWAPASPVLDEAVSRVDPGSPGGFYRPGNYDGRFHGTVTMRAALANSYNIPAILTQDAVGTKQVITMARKLGVTTDLPEVPSLSLGAGTVRLLEMTGAYGVFANLGTRVDTTPFLKVETLDGRVLWEFQAPYEDHEIWPQTAYLINDVLSDNAARRPAFGNVLDLANRRTAAVKTGTTNDYKDSWTIGYTPSLVTGVWVGNTDNSAMLQVAGSLGAGYIWKDFMDQTLGGQPDEPFPVPPDIKRGPVCAGKPETDVFHGSPFPSCPEPLKGGPEWHAGQGGTSRR